MRFDSLFTERIDFIGAIELLQTGDGGVVCFQEIGARGALSLQHELAETVVCFLVVTVNAQLQQPFQRELVATGGGFGRKHGDGRRCDKRER